MESLTLSIPVHLVILGCESKGCDYILHFFTGQISFHSEIKRQTYLFQLQILRFILLQDVTLNRIINSILLYPIFHNQFENALINNFIFYPCNVWMFSYKNDNNLFLYLMNYFLYSCRGYYLILPLFKYFEYQR